MAFNRLVSAAVCQMTAPNSSTKPSILSGLVPPAGPYHSFGLVNPRQKNNLQLSSSLQDFSRYHRLDQQEGDLNLGTNQSANFEKWSHSLDGENDGSCFSKENTLPGIPFIGKKWAQATMAILSIVLFLCLIFMCAKHFSTYWSQEASQFYVILDCGSTGTRVYAYESSINNKRDGNFPIFLRPLPEGLQRKSNSQSGRAYQRMETEPGFDKLVHNISGLRAAIKPLLQWAENQIPKHAHKSTSLFLYATGGARRLPNSDSEWLLDNTWSILRNSAFHCQREWVKIITGMEEAYYGWMALNYLMGLLGSTSKKATFGALDLGGSSLQVTFETKEPVHDETSLNVSIGHVNHILHAYSLSGYGLNDAFDKSVVHLLKRLPGFNKADLINGKIELNHPCLQSGYKEKYICSQCASLNQGGSPLIGGRNIGKGEKHGITVTLLGAPHWEECSGLAKVTVNLSEWSGLNPGIDCELQPCALTNSLPQPRGQFFAISGFFVVFRFFDLTSEDTLDDLLQKGREFCEKTWEVARNSVAPQPFIEQYCFRAPYIESLLREGLHITDKQLIIGSGNITWTLGVALLKARGALPTAIELHSHGVVQMKINPIIAYTVVFMSLILLICALSYFGNWMPFFFYGPHLPLFRHNRATVTSVLSIPPSFWFQRWSPISSGDGRVKMPLSPTIGSSQQKLFDMEYGSGSSIQLTESSLNLSTVSVSHSYSSSSLRKMQCDNNNMASFWTPHRSQMQLQSRRSQSREDLYSSLADAHMVKV